MRMYCYTFYAKLIMEQGYLSMAANPKSQMWKVHLNKAEIKTREGVMKYLEETFVGRTKSICCLNHIAPSKEYEHAYLNNLTKNASVISFKLEDLIRDGLVEGIYCKDNREYARQQIFDKENIYKITNLEEIDDEMPDWDNCKEEYCSPYNMIKHYFIILKNGLIPTKYLRLEKQGKENEL